MCKTVINLAKDLTDNAMEFPQMLDYASVIVTDNSQERKNRNHLKRELNKKYKERNRRKKVNA